MVTAGHAVVTEEAVTRDLALHNALKSACIMGTGHSLEHSVIPVRYTSVVTRGKHTLRKIFLGAMSSIMFTGACGVTCEG